MLAQPESLRAYLALYIERRNLAPSTIEQMQIVVGVFQKWLERSATLADLTERNLNRWIIWLRATGRKEPTIRNRRGVLMSLWRAALSDGLISESPDNVQIVKRVNGVPVAWSIDEVRDLLRAARTLKGRYGMMRRGRGPWIPRRWYWVAYIRTAWDSGLRKGDLLQLRISEITPDGLLVVRQEKTGYPHIIKLRKKTLAAIHATFPPRRNVIFPWPASVYGKSFYPEFRALVDLSGIRPGSSKWLRRSSATAIEAKHPGSAMAHLGHRTPGLAYKHYVDPRLLQNTRPMPPEL